MTKFNQLKTGEKLSETQFYIVEKIAGDQIQLKPDAGESIVVDKSYAESFLTSASQFTETKPVTRTELTEIIRSNPARAITINFNKQVKAPDVTKEIIEAHENSTPKAFAAVVAKAVKKALDGEERTIVGRHYNSYDEFGRLHFTDMEIAQDASKNYDVRQRLVDPRTANWVIAENVKYIKK